MTRQSETEKQRQVWQSSYWPSDRAAIRKVGLRITTNKRRLKCRRRQLQFSLQRCRAANQKAYPLWTERDGEIANLLIFDLLPQ